MAEITDSIIETKTIISEKLDFNEKEELPYSLEICHQLEKIAADADLIKKNRPSRYDKGKILDLNITGVYPAYQTKATFEIEKFIGGGFAGQVYRARLLQIANDNGALIPNNAYAIKILVPPSGFALFFRNLIYWLAYQGPFSAQVNYAAARVGVLWQKLIRRGAKIYFGTERAVVDTYATFYDRELNSYGEINEWVNGRNWKFEIDDRVFRRKKLGITEKVIKGINVGSLEYLAKRNFMNRMVRLFHDMGAPELARQYEWGTMKSQPNALLRLDSSNGSVDDLTGIDFRAGLALLPFLPMSPADFKLIVQGIVRGSFVQFDRGDLKKLEDFIEKYKVYFEDLLPAFQELKELEPQYRRSLPDLSHQGFKLIFSRSLRFDVATGLIKGWKCRELLDDEHAQKLNKSTLRFVLYYIVGCLPFCGKLIRKVWGNRYYAHHLKLLITDRNYFKRALRAKQAATLVDWHRDGRVNKVRALKLVDRPFRFWSQRFLLSWLPPKWHQFLTEARYAWSTIKYAVAYPIRFYRDNEFREQWLLEQINAGQQEGMLTAGEAANIKSSIKDPFIQKYLKCLAVHICTLPITQVISIIVALYAMIKFGDTWAEGLLYGSAILAAFQATPISPGSLVRGSYVVYLMIKERNIRNYWVAALISFWHYVGYLGFPIQMVAKFPALARLMAGRWATTIVHLVPVFGERGALLEHWVFDLFFNVPISIRRWFKKT